MTSLRSRLTLAIVLVVGLCIGLTVGVGLVLTRRAVDKATLLDVCDTLAPCFSLLITRKQ